MSSQNSYVETLTPSGMVFRGEAFKKQSGLDQVMRVEPS